MMILAIETSCDETSAAIVESQPSGLVNIRSHVVYSQMNLLRRFGGVYPEAASREHVKKIGVVIEQTLEGLQETKDRKQKTELQDIIQRNIDAIAVTVGPGLIGSLLVGVNAAKTLAYAFGKPLIGVHHHEGHIAAAWLTDQKTERSSQSVPEYPIVALVVSGGHTLLVELSRPGTFNLLGRTRDDAAGEAFDKVARLLNLSYPGGPAIAAAAKLSTVNGQRSTVVKLPRPMLDSGDYAFSFSGLKTAVAQLVNQIKPLDRAKTQAIAWEFQEAAADVLVAKTLRAVHDRHPKSLIIAGGVAANQRLREKLQASLAELPAPPQLYLPAPRLCTDNAAMIGAAAVERALANRYLPWYDCQADDSLQLDMSSWSNNQSPILQ